jgi:hypothetical protein
MDKRLIQRLAREAGISETRLHFDELDDLCDFATLVVEQCVQVAHTRAGYWDDNRAKIVAEDVATGINSKFGSEKSRDDNKPQPLQEMDHLFAKHADAAAEAAKQLVQERAGERRGIQYVCDVPGKFLDMTEHAGRLIILTESGVFELRPGETALRQPQPMTPQDATELDKHNQLVGVTNDEGQWRYTTYPVQFKKED